MQSRPALGILNSCNTSGRSSAQGASCMFLNIKEMEVRRIQFDESFEPGEIDFADTGLRQATSVRAVGSARLLEHTGGEIRVQGRFSGTMEADCDRCL